MQTLVIQTQHKENYGAHDWDGKGECPQYWKFKGGNTYFVTGLTGKQINKIAQHGIPTLSKLIESKNEMFEEYILDWEIRDLGKNGDGKGPICEPWETPIEFYWGGDRWLCRTHHTPSPEYSHYNPAIIGKAEQWIPLEGGDRSDYKSQFKTKNGWFDYNDPKLREEIKEVA